MTRVEYGKINLFYSYAHEDEASCREVMRSLEPLRTDGTISEWYDRQIKPGKNWRDEISENLDRAKIILLMIGPDFLASDYCMGVELKQALERHWERQCRIVPIILRSCPWTKTRFGSFQALPRDGMPVAKWSNENEAMSSIAEGIRTVCRDIVDWENPYRRCSIGDWTETEQTTLVKQSGQQLIAAMVVRVLAKSQKKKSATVGFTASVNGQIIPMGELQRAGMAGGAFQMDADRVEIPLDVPLEDNLGAFMRQLRVNMPRDAEVERKETGRGEQKIWIGGRHYYCTWKGHEMCISCISQGLERFTVTGKTWRCIDVPLDGIVKVEQETPYSRTRMVLLDYGFGGPKAS